MSTLPRPIFPDNWPPKPMRKWPPSWRCWTFGARCAGWCPACLSPNPPNFPPSSNPHTRPPAGAGAPPPPPAPPRQRGGGGGGGGQGGGGGRPPPGGQGAGGAGPPT